MSRIFLDMGLVHHSNNFQSGIFLQVIKKRMPTL
jgi:hypothetical protein